MAEVGAVVFDPLASPERKGEIVGIIPSVLNSKKTRYEVDWNGEEGTEMCHGEDFITRN